MRNGYANLIAARLRKLGAAGSTGMLPVSGRGDGAIFFRGGQVIYAESRRTPAPVQPAPAASARTPAAVLVAAGPLGRLAGVLALTEPTIDAITELLSSESRYAKFRQSDFPPVAPVGPMPVESVLTEVERRRQVLRQLAPAVTADTPVVCDASRDSPRFQVSAPQWALLVCVGGGTTPRTLAMSLGRSVFGTTIEVYRLLALGLLAVPGRTAAPAGGRIFTAC